MVLFWVVAVLLILAALFFLVPPVLQRQQQVDAAERRQININIHRDKMAELDQDLATGVLSQELYDTARKEVEADLLSDVNDEGVAVDAADAAAQQRFARFSLIVIVALVPILSMIMYASLGGGKAAFNPKDAVPEVAAEGHENNIEGMVSQLLQRLADDPNDVEGWMMLGRSYQFMKNFEKAASAYKKAVELSGGQDPNLLADYADALAVSNNRSMAGEPIELVKKALAISPNHEKALWLAGTAAYQVGDLNNAYAFWEKLRNQFPPGSENWEALERNLQEVRGMMAQAGLEVPKDSAPAAAASATGVSGTSVSGRVELVAALTGNASPEDTVFVFARAANGPPMPLAVLRKKVKDLPVEFTLDDSMAMSPQMKLSSFPEVVVGARISKTGNAMPQSGDMQGLSPVVSVGTTGIPVTINSVVP